MHYRHVNVAVLFKMEVDVGIGQSREAWENDRLVNDLFFFLFLLLAISSQRQQWRDIQNDVRIWDKMNIMLGEWKLTEGDYFWWQPQFFCKENCPISLGCWKYQLLEESWGSKICKLMHFLKRQNPINLSKRVIAFWKWSMQNNINCPHTVHCQNRRNASEKGLLECQLK